MNKRELKKLERTSQYDYPWRKWRQGQAPKFRLSFWGRLQLNLNRKVLEYFAYRMPGDAHIHSTLGALASLESKDEASKGDGEAAARLRQEAIHRSREAVALAPNDTHAHFMLGTALDGDKQHDAALAEYEEVLRLDPADPNGHSLVSLSLQRQGKLTEAVAEARQALALQPTAHGHLRLGTLLNTLGQMAEAREEWEKVLTLDKGYLASAARLYLQGRY